MIDKERMVGLGRVVGIGVEGSLKKKKKKIKKNYLKEITWSLE